MPYIQLVPSPGPAWLDGSVVLLGALRGLTVPGEQLIYVYQQKTLVLLLYTAAWLSKETL